MKHDVSLLICVVNYKSHILVADLIDSLQSAELPSNTELCIVDNNSQDNSVSELTAHLNSAPRPYRFHLIASALNGGFAYGNNVAIKTFVENNGYYPDYTLLLNPDTRVTDTAIVRLVEFLENNVQAGIAGSELLSEQGKPQVSCFRFHSLASEFISGSRLGWLNRTFNSKVVAMPVPLENKQVDWVAGASMMIKKAVLEGAGLMDEDYFLYFEETDFCLQAKKAGWQCWFVPASKVVHYEGRSTGVKSGDTSRKRRPAYWFESRQRYFRKNFGGSYTLLADMCWILAYVSWMLRRFVQRKQNTDPKRLLLDFLNHSIWLKPFKVKQR